MAHRKTLTMSWDGLGDVDDDDAFFDSYNRLSIATSVDLTSSSDDDFDDPRLSFASAVSSAQSRKSRANLSMDLTPDYGIWMATPMSITERRKRLLHGMGLDNDREFSKATSIDLSQEISKNLDLSPSSNSSEKTIFSATSLPVIVIPSDSSVPAEKKTEHSVHFVVVRSRSEGDIDLFSIERSRKESFIGNGSKQQLTRTGTVALTLERNQNKTESRAVVRDSDDAAHSKQEDVKLEDSGVRAYVLIKNLDTGKEFIVNEYGKNGGFRLSDLQTGKQITMEEFEKTVGKSHVVNELMSRANSRRSYGLSRKLSSSSYISRSLKLSKRRGVALLKNIKDVASGFIGEREPVQPGTLENKNKWVRVRHTGKTHKELSALHLCQEFQAHEGCVWTMKFSLDGRYMASAGEDRVIHVWEVQQCEVMSLRSDEGSVTPIHPSLLASPSESPPPLSSSDKKKKGKFGSKSSSTTIPEYVHVPETVFSLSDKPYCSFHGHLDDILDLSWSKSQLLLSSSMDKTVRLWSLETKIGLNTFAHKDYVTSVHFNPMHDDYFISGSLDAKVRIWNIPERHVVDWIDTNEMVTAVSYTPDGQGAIVGTHKGNCRTYSTQGCKLTQTGSIEIRRHKKKSQLRKITGFQFVPGKPSEVLVTSADSRIRILNGSEVVQKYRGFQNANSQILASFSSDGRYIISASEDSQVYIWKHEEHKSGGNGKGRNVLVTRSHEHFQCKDVSVAITWPCSIRSSDPLQMHHSKKHSKHSNNCGEDTATSSPSCANNRRVLPPLPKKSSSPKEQEHAHAHDSLGSIQRSHSSLDQPGSFANNKRMMMPQPPLKVNYHTPKEEDNHEAMIMQTDLGFSDSFSLGSSPIRSGGSDGDSSSSSASWSPSNSSLESSHASSTTLPPTWGLVIVTAGIGGEIKCFQNFGFPKRIGRQPHLFGGHNSFSHGHHF